MGWIAQWIAFSVSVNRTNLVLASGKLELQEKEWPIMASSLCLYLLFEIILGFDLMQNFCSCHRCCCWRCCRCCCCRCCCRCIQLNCFSLSVAICKNVSNFMTDAEPAAPKFKHTMTSPKPISSKVYT